MKRTSLSKSVRTFGLMAMLSVLVATTLQQPIQAQSKGNKVPTTADGTCAPLPEGTTYQEFGGITFSQKQKQTYRKSAAKLAKKVKAITSAPTLVDDPERSTVIYFNDWIGDKKTAEINAMMDSLKRDKVPSDKRVELINKKYGKYAKASIVQFSIYTPEQITAGQQAGLDFEAEMMSIFTPEQQKTYRANLAIQRRIQACSEPDPNAKIISPLPF
jgi:hypothetical protein